MPANREKKTKTDDGHNHVLCIYRIHSKEKKTVVMQAMS